MTLKRKFDSRTLTAVALLAALSLLPAAFALAQQDHRPPEQQPGQNPPQPLPPPPDPNAPAPPDETGPANAPEQAEATTGDAEILAQLKAVDENELRAAAAAQQKKVTGQVRKYARMLEEDHSKDLQDVQQLGDKLGLTLTATTTVDQLHARGEEILSRLSPLTGDEFNRTFVTEMVNGHREALQMIDDFLKTAQNEDVRSHLSQVRDRIAMHLREGEKLQGSLGPTDRERPASSQSREDQPLTS
jgi:putative membrane protein